MTGEAVFADQTIVARDSTCKNRRLVAKPISRSAGRCERTTDLKVVRIVDGGFGGEGLAVFVLLLDLGRLVLDLQRRHHALGQDTCAESPRSAARDAPVEDQLHLIGTPDVEILPGDLLEETPAGDRTIEHLR